MSRIECSKNCCGRRTLQKYALVDVISFLLVLLFGFSTVGWAQDLEASLGWRSIGVEGNIVYVPVRLDGYDLFAIAAERAENGGGKLGLGNIFLRRKRIEYRLKTQLQDLIAQNSISLESLQVNTTRLNQQMVVQAVVAGKAENPLLTVTTLDAEIYGMTEAEVAEVYAQRIRTAFLRGLYERKPSVQRSQVAQAFITAAVAIAILLFLLWWQRRIGKDRKRLRHELHNLLAVSVPEIDVENESVQSQHDPNLQQQSFHLKRQIEQKTAERHLLQLLSVVVGVLGVGLVLQRFPQTRAFGGFVVKQPLLLLLIGSVVGIAIISSRRIIDWLLIKWVGTEDRLAEEQIERRKQQVPTLSAVWKDVSAAILILLGVVFAFRAFSLSTGLTFFTEIGIAGVTVSLIFQSSIKDAMSGWMLLAHDAFTVGDIVAVKDVVGVVEEMNLFITKIRSSAGDAITIRNGEITYITNRSKEWARLDLFIMVDYDTDINQAMRLMRTVFQIMQSDAEWGAKLIGEPDILGIAQFERDGISIQFRTKTQPGKQFEIAREFRFRLIQAFHDAGVKIPIHQREVRYRS